MNVLSLFDGMSCGQQALERAGIKIDKYFASEIDKYAIKVTMANYPNTIQLGNVVNVSAKTILLSEVYHYICKKYFKDYIQSLQSIIPEWEMLHRINESQVFSSYFGTQIESEKNGTQSNSIVSINDRIWFWKNPMGDNKGIYDIIRCGNRGKIPNTIDVGEMCKHSFWWNGNGQYESKIERKGFDGIEGENCEGINQRDIEKFSKETIFNNRIEGASKNKSITTISRSTKKAKLFDCNKKNRQGIGGREEEENRSSKEGIEVQKNERIVLPNYEIDRIGEINRLLLSIYKEVQVTIIECEWGVIIFKNCIQISFGGSPCQSFSFAGKRKGMATKDEIEIHTLEHYLQLKNDGYEFEGQSYLFWEFMRILNEVKPKYFLLENVIMAAKWERILSRAIGVNPIKINSALVSAQNRRRLYWTNIGMKSIGLFGELESTIQQPKDKGILLKDVLESDVDEKYFISQRMINAFNIKTNHYKSLGGGFEFQPTEGDRKGRTLTNPTKNRMDDNWIIIKCARMTGRDPENPKSRKPCSNTEQMIEERFDEKSGALATVPKDNYVRKVIQLSDNNKSNGGSQPYQQDRIYDINGISPALDGLSCKKIISLDGLNENQLKKFDTNIDSDKANTLTLAQGRAGSSTEYMDSVSKIAKITSNIRRLTPIECERLQTIPDNYTNHVSDSQRYKMLGNGWTVEVISHIFNYLKNE